MSLVLIFGFAGVANAALYPSNEVTPSTNDINRTNGWAHVNQISVGIGEVTLEFVQPRNFYAGFEYRTDGDTSQVINEVHWLEFYGVVPAGALQLYPSFDLATAGTQTHTIYANEYVEVRMMFGAEGDERFDWTRFDVLPVPFVRSATITSPLAGEEVFGTVSFDATLTDEGEDDNVQWAVRKGTCAANTNTVLGNVDGFSSPFTWDHINFHALAATSFWVPGNYCFVFNPTESVGDTAIRETREFVIKDTIAPLVTIESPSEGNVVSGTVEIHGTVVEDYILSHYNISVYPGDADFNDFSERIAQSTVYRSTGFINEPIFEWNSTAWGDGEYLIRLAARDAAGNRSYAGSPLLGGDDSQHVIRVIVNNTPDNKDQCKKDGWKIWLNPVFRNQGDCVSYVVSNDNAGKRE